MYEVMDTLIETEHYFLLFTKEWQITIIAKDGMDLGEKDRFLKMMEEKMPGLKRKYGRNNPEDICKMEKYRSRI